MLGRLVRTTLILPQSVLSGFVLLFSDVLNVFICKYMINYGYNAHKVPFIHISCSGILVEKCVIA